jgi:hypothetical protein
VERVAPERLRWHEDERRGIDSLQLDKEITQDGGHIALGVTHIIECFNEKTALRVTRQRLTNDHRARVSEQEAGYLMEIRHGSCSHEILWLRSVVAADTLHTGHEVRHMCPQGTSAKMGVYKYYGAQILEERPPSGMVCQNTRVQHLRRSEQ